jgi:hypothetical protein
VEWIPLSDFNNTGQPGMQTPVVQGSDSDSMPFTIGARMAHPVMECSSYLTWQGRSLSQNRYRYRYRKSKSPSMHLALISLAAPGACRPVFNKGVQIDVDSYCRAWY